MSHNNRYSGALGRIRTPDPLIRSQVLYPAELPARESGVYPPSSVSARAKSSCDVAGQVDTKDGALGAGLIQFQTPAMATDQLRCDR